MTTPPKPPPLSVRGEAKGLVRTFTFSHSQRKVLIQDLRPLPPLHTNHYLTKTNTPLNGLCTLLIWTSKRGDEWPLCAFMKSLRPAPTVTQVLAGCLLVEPETELVTEVTCRTMRILHNKTEWDSVEVYFEYIEKDFNCPDQSTLLNRALRVGMTTHHTYHLETGLVLSFIRPWWLDNGPSGAPSEVPPIPRV